MRRALLLLTAAVLFAQQQPAVRVGPLPTGGYLLPTGWIVRPADQQISVDKLPLHSVLTPDGRFLIVIHGGSPTLHVIDAKAGKTVQQLTLPSAWSGMSMIPTGRMLYVSGGAGAAIYELAISPEGRLERRRTFETVPAAKRTTRDFIGDLAITPDGRLIYAADYFNDQIVVINPQSGRVIDRFKCGRRPYRILFHPDGKSYFVTASGSGTLEQFMTDDGYRMGALRLGPQVTGMIWRGKPTVVEQTSDNPTQSAFPYRARIFVAASNTNRVFSVGVTESKEMRLVESISIAMTRRQPLGSIPVALSLSEDEERLYVVCSGLNAVAVADVRTPQARVEGFVPTEWHPTAAVTLSNGRLAVLSRGSQQGSISIIEAFDEAKLKTFTSTVFENSPYDDRILDGSLLPPRPANLAALQHVIYVVTESAGKAPRLAESVSFDNFHSSGEGKLWPTAAFPGLPLPSISSEPPPTPPAGYLWTQVLAAGLSMRNYGYPVDWDRALAAVTNTRYAAGPTDVDRAKVFLEDLKQFESSGTMPRFLILRLGAIGSPDTDAALGNIIEACSRSKFWPGMAIFVTSAAPPEADSFRAPAFLISPMARRGTTDSTFYNTTSMLRTIEMILGLRPMTIFDTASPPMWSAFAAPAATASRTQVAIRRR